MLILFIIALAIIQVVFTIQLFIAFLNFCEIHNIFGGMINAHGFWPVVLGLLVAIVAAGIFWFIARFVVNVATVVVSALVGIVAKIFAPNDEDKVQELLRMGVIYSVIHYLIFLAASITLSVWLVDYFAANPELNAFLASGSVWVFVLMLMHVFSALSYKNSKE